MPIDIAQVKSLVRKSISNGSLLLTDSALQSETIQALFDAYFPNGALLMTVDRVDETADSISVVGTGTVEPLTAVGCQAKFVVDSGEAECQIAGTISTAWRFSESFQSLRPSIFSKLVFNNGGQLLLDSSELKKGSGKPGMSFSGKLQLGSFSQNVGWLLGGIAEIDIQGPISINHGEPDLDLRAPNAARISIGGFSLPHIGFRLVSQYLEETAEEPPRRNGFAEFSSKISFTAQGLSHELPVTATFYDFTPNLVLRLDPNAIVDAGIQEISNALSGGADLSSIWPAGLKLPSTLKLTDLVLSVDLAKGSLNSVGIGVQTAEKWTIFGSSAAPAKSVFEIDQVALLFKYTLSSKTLSAVVFGNLTLGSGRVEISADVSTNPFFTGMLAQGDSINLKEVAEYFVGPNKDLPEMDVSTFAFQIEPGESAYQAEVSLATTWTLSIGTVKLQLVELGFSISHDKTDTKSEITARAIVGKLNLAMDWQLPGDFQLSASIPEITLHELISTFSSDPLWVGGFPDLALKDSTVYLEKRQDGSVYLSIGTSMSSSSSHPAFGVIEFDFQESSGKTGYAAGFLLQQTFTLGMLSSALSSLDFIELKEAGLLLSSIQDPNFQFRSFTEPNFSFPSQLPNAPAGISPGLALYADLKLAGGPLDPIGKLLSGIDELKLAAVFPTDLSKSRFSADLKGHFDLIGSYITLQDVGVDFSPGQTEFDLRLLADFTIHGTKLALQGTIAVAASDVAIALKTVDKWNAPFGIRGLTLDALGIEIQLGAVIGLTLAGEISIKTGNDTTLDMEAAMEFSADEEGLPDVFLAKEVGTIDLAQIVYTFAPEVSFPKDLLDIKLSDFQLIIVANPEGWNDPIDNKHYSPGLAVGGVLAFFGLEARFAIQVDYSTGISAMGEIDKPLDIEGIVKLEGATDPTKGPSVSLSTAASPYLELSAALTLFEIISERISALIAKDKLHIEFEYDIATMGKVAFAADIEGKTGFAVAALAKFDIGKLGPIKAGSLNLGTLNIDLHLDAHFAIAISTSSFSLTIGATFKLHDLDLKLDDITLHQKFTRLSDLPKIFADNLAALLWDIAKSLFQDAEALFEFVGKGLLTLAADIGKILKDELKVGLEDAAKLLKSVANAMAYDAEEVAKLLSAGFNAAEHDIAKAMKAAEYEVEEVAEAIAKEFGKGAEEVAHILKAIGYDLEEIAKALKAFGWAAKEVATFFKDVFKEAEDAVHAALKAAEYAVNEIEDAMKSAFNWLKHAAEKVGHALNPKNW